VRAIKPQTNQGMIIKPKTPQDWSVGQNRCGRLLKKSGQIGIRQNRTNSVRLDFWAATFLMSVSRNPIFFLTGTRTRESRVRSGCFRYASSRADVWERRESPLSRSFQFSGRKDGGGRSRSRTCLSIQFPANREINREFRRIRPLDAILNANTRANSEACNKIPYATEQGIIFEKQGICSQEQGI
jgi:hypothetical protein